MFRQLKREVDAAAGDGDDLARVAIPAEPGPFYADLGCLPHPRTRRSVVQLAPYQIETWKALLECGRVLVIKSNKIGLSTSTLMVDFQLAVLPSSHPRSCRGYDQLLIAQTIQHAREHLYTLRKLDSPKYRPWLIVKSHDMVLKDEATKVTVLYIRNPENENRPSRIIGLGLNNAGSVLSWKNVKHIHISDPTAAEGDYSHAINAGMTRLANTSGSMVIETVPAGPRGRIYELFQQFNAASGGPAAFRVFVIPASEAVKAGVIAQDFLDAERERLGGLYGQYYGAKFVAAGGSILLPSQVDACVMRYSLALQEGAYRVMAVDWGFGSSRTAIVGIERRVDGRLYVVDCRQFERAAVSGVIDLVALQYHADGYSQCYADSSQPGIIKDLQDGSELTGRPAVDVRPVVFREELPGMVQEVVKAVREARVLIHPEFADVISQLKAVQYDRKGNPDKSAHTMDVFDAFMMAVSHVQEGGSLYIADIGSLF
ncbi:MAG: hypothetical protein ABI347_01675 [Nitrososphaera sp.]|jgi:hypothetical protein